MLLLSLLELKPSKFVFSVCSSISMLLLSLLELKQQFPWYQFTAAKISMLLLSLLELKQGESALIRRAFVISMLLQTLLNQERPCRLCICIIKVLLLGFLGNRSRTS